MDFPHITFLTNPPLSAAHGAGSVYLRLLEGWPPDRLTNWHGSAGTVGWPNHVLLEGTRWPPHRFWPPDVLAGKAWNRLAPAALPRWSLPIHHAAARRFAAAQPCPTLLHVLADTVASLHLLEALLRAWPRTPPVILEFQDYFPHAHLGMGRALRRLRPHLALTWAATPAIARDLDQRADVDAVVESPIAMDLPPTWKTAHRPATPGFRTIVFGNFWNLGMVPALKNLWRRCQDQMPGLGPIHWHCHADGLAYVRAGGMVPEPEIQPAPFLSGTAAAQALQEADLAIVPFSLGRAPASDYERYSIPSRLAELMAAGLPCFCLTGGDTPLREFLDNHRCGMHAPADDLEAASRQLLGCIHDSAARHKLGEAARRTAAAFNMAEKRRRIFDCWRRLASCQKRT